VVGKRNTDWERIKEYQLNIQTIEQYLIVLIAGA